MVVKPFRSPGHCSGNIALKASYQANENAAWFFEFLDGDISPDRRYLPAALLVDLGRAAAKYAYSEPMFRDALAKGWRRTRIAGSRDTTHEFR